MATEVTCLLELDTQSLQYSIAYTVQITSSYTVQITSLSNPYLEVAGIETKNYC